MKTVSQYLREQFGKRIYKISLDAGFTCPNRDGSCGTDGCIFCSGSGSGDFAEESSLTIEEQLEHGKKQVEKKEPEGYIAYYQAFTNTYASVEKLKKVYEPALKDDSVVAISIATRPDCLPDEVCDLLAQINKIKPVWVELGLQTIHEESARYIRRGYPLAVYDRAVEKLKAVGIEQIITHVILGLPGENRTDMLETVDYVCKSGADGIKLQLLHVLENTDLAEDYRKGLFETLSFEEYTTLVVECMKLLPEDYVLHRMTGDGAKEDLIAPLWSLDKRCVLNEIRHKASLEGIIF